MKFKINIQRYIENVYNCFSRKILDDIDMIKLTVESIKNRQKIEDLLKRRDDIPSWALDIIRPLRKDSIILRYLF